MNKKIIGIFLVGLLGGIVGSIGVQLSNSQTPKLLNSNTAEAEQITLTTYYPSPFGMYDGLGAYRLSVGDTNGDSNINNADLPTAQGDLYVKGNLLVITGTITAQGGLIVETRITDPATPPAGRIWVRTDL